jgi:hypothetical protein
MKVAEYQFGYYSTVDLVSHVPIKMKIELNHHETFRYEGVNYLIHNPYEMFSKLSASHQTVNLCSMIVYVNPQKKIIDEALKSYEPKRFEVKLLAVRFTAHVLENFRRGCYLENEKPLKFFKKFTKNNCKLECLANKTVTVCGCAQFFMVREVSTRVCGVEDMKCYKKVEEELKNQNWCECLLECGEIEYKTEQKFIDFLK